MRPVRFRSNKEKEQNKLRMKIVGLNPEYRKARATYQRHRKNRRKYWLNKYKEARGCDRCNFKGVGVCYDWHHLGDKEFEINSSMSKNLKRLFNEIRKCVLVCSNCHRIIHYEERVSSGS